MASKTFPEALLNDSPQNGAWVAAKNRAVALVHGGPRPALCGLASWTSAVLVGATLVALAWPSLASAQDQVKEKAPETSPAAPQEAPDAPPLFENWKIRLEAGARNYDLYGDRPGKFFETRDITKGVYIRGLDLRFESADSPIIFFVKGTDIRERDESVKSDFWRVGKFRTTFLWDRLPYFYSDGTSLFQNAGGGNFLVSPSIRASFQSVVDGQTPPNISPALGPLVRAELSRAPVTDLRVKRDQAVLRQTVRFGRLELHAQWRSVFQRGSRPKAIGTFARGNIGPGTPPDGIWESIGVELPEPVDYRTHHLTAGAIVSGKKWRLGVDYGLTLFRNHIPTLTYENPFRVTDAAGLPPGGPVGRNRFVRQQASLPPNTDYHSVTVRGGFDLHKDTQFRGLFSWGRSSQNDQFLPYTINTALVGTTPGLANNLPPGTSVLNVSSLPQQSLNGQVRNLNYDSTLVSRPRKDMTFRLQYRADDVKNESPRIVFAGQPRFGDSHWVTGEDYYGLPIENFPTSYVKKDIIAAWRWDATKRVSWNAEYQFESFNRTFRDVPRSGEHSIRGRLDIELAKKATFKADYTYSDRRPENYITTPLVFSTALNGWEVVRAQTFPQFQRGVPLEFNQLRRFDVSARKRQDGKAAFNAGLGDKVTVSASGQYRRDNYAKGFYGLTFEEMFSADGEVTYTAGERAFLYLNYSHQLDRYGALGMGNLITGAVVNGNPCCAQYPIANTWQRDSRTKLNFVQTGLNWASSGEKTTIDLSYGFSFAKDVLHSSNPFTIRVDSPYTAGTYNYPDTKNGYQEVFLSVSRKLRPGLELGFQYRFDAYQLDDFYLNPLQPYSQGLVTAPGLVINLQRQLLLNARFTTYHAHQEWVFLKYSF